LFNIVLTVVTPLLTATEIEERKGEESEEGRGMKAMEMVQLAQQVYRELIHYVITDFMPLSQRLRRHAKGLRTIGRMNQKCNQRKGLTEKRK